MSSGRVSRAVIDKVKAAFHRDAVIAPIRRTVYRYVFAETRIHRGGCGLVFRGLRIAYLYHCLGKDV